jgi:hypothetical protein
MFDAKLRNTARLSEATKATVCCGTDCQALIPVCRSVTSVLVYIFLLSALKLLFCVCVCAFPILHFSILRHTIIYNYETDTAN